MARFIWLLLLSACTHQPTPMIRIEGQVTGIPDGMLYLAEARKWKTPLDSVYVSSGKFSFRIKADSAFEPFLADLHYWKNELKTQPVRLQFRNHTRPDSLTVLRDVFWVEPGLITIEGNAMAAPWLRIRAGNENELLYRHQFGDIGWMGERDSAARKEKINRLKVLIQENPSSHFLLQSIADSKESYNKEELLSMLSLFPESLRRSAAGQGLQDYLRRLPGSGEAYPWLTYADGAGRRQALLDSNARLNMLVFWASWCQPCIKELPQLQSLYREFGDRGLHLVSISIDEDVAEWKQAIQRYRLPWPQVHTGAGRIMETEQVFRFTSIPFLVFTDRQGRELARFSGYDPDNIAAYRAFIRKYIR